DETEKPGPSVIQKKITVEGLFQNVRIYGDVSMILTNEPSGTMVMEGKEKDVNRIRHRVKDNELVIDARRKNYFNKLVIYLPAAMIQSMQVNGDGDISSTGMIQSEKLHITLNGVIDVKIKTTGKFSVDAPDDLELKWKSPFKQQAK
ncbi:MAG TPA: DUF2807 domain-containing protein, partial [Chitinophagaceae bacterium]|nr:DUF2807 domain-containing protein [Chitinophagaceae bacterium]